MTFLLDTCVLSKLRKLSVQKDSALKLWVEKHEESQFFLSVLTIGEIQKGIYSLKDQKHKRLLEEWYKGQLIPRFSKRILDIDLHIMSKWGELAGFYKRKGKSLPVIDSLIASTAIVHDLIVVTENVKDFSLIKECKIFNPWE